jgi:flagellar biosynthesis/type III secretory pathway protein FliH
MGKVVKGARVARDLYFLSVPEVELEEAHSVNGELDERFASPDGSLAFSDDDETSFDDAPEFAEPVLVPTIDWEAVRAEAREIVDRAVEGSEAMLRDAATRAQALVAQAQAEADGIRVASRALGHDEGVAAGRTEIEAQLAQTVSSLQSLIEEARAQRQIVIESAEPELVRLAMSIAERIVHEQITVDPKVVVDNVRQALTRLVGREVVTLRVNPADLDTIRAHRDTIANANDVEHLRVVEDQRVDRGGVIVETDAGTIDAKVSTQIREARRTLLAEPSVFSPAQAS